MKIKPEVKLIIRTQGGVKVKNPKIKLTTSPCG